MASTVFAFESKEVEDSLEQLNESKDENSGRREEEGGEERTCVVCLSPIESKSKIRVTYCRHIFHSHCLLGWFKKNEVRVIIARIALSVGTIARLTPHKQLTSS
jgi:hypothetical protein